MPVNPWGQMPGLGVADAAEERAWRKPKPTPFNPATGAPGLLMMGPGAVSNGTPQAEALMRNGVDLDRIPVGGADQAFSQPRQLAHDMPDWPETSNTYEDTYSMPGTSQTGAESFPYPNPDMPYGDPSALYPADPPGQLDPGSLQRLLAEHRVSKDRESQASTPMGQAGQSLSDYIRLIARGTFGGPWSDELEAGTESALGVAPYDESLAYQNALDDQIDEENPAASPALRLGTMLGTAFLPGGQPNGVSALVSGPGFLNASSKLKGLPGMLSSGAKSAGIGGIYGANYGAGETRGTTDDRIEAGAASALLGAEMGLVPGMAFSGHVAEAASPLVQAIRSIGGRRTP